MIGPVSRGGLPSVERNERIQPVTPYLPMPYRGDTRPFFRFGADRLSRPAKAAAEAAAEWASSSRQARSGVHALLDYRSTAWQQRIVVSADGDSVRGTAARGAAMRGYQVEVDKLAQNQRNEGFDLAAGAGSVVEAGRHTFALDVGGKRHELSVDIGSFDTNAKAMAIIGDAVNGQGIGVTASLISDKAAGTVSLALTSVNTGTDNAFRIVDLNGGSAVSATGVGTTRQAASNAQYRVDGHPPVTASENAVQLDAGKVKLALTGVTDGPLNVRVGVDAGAIVTQTACAVDALNGLAFLYRKNEAWLNPALMRELGEAMDTGGMSAFGVMRQSSGGWQLDKARLRAVIEASPEQAQLRLAGPHGWAASVDRTLDRFGRLPMEALINPASQTMMAYTAYRANAGSYWQLPPGGWLFSVMS